MPVEFGGVICPVTQCFLLSFALVFILVTELSVEWLELAVFSHLTVSWIAMLLLAVFLLVFGNLVVISYIKECESCLRS